MLSVPSTITVGIMKQRIEAITRIPVNQQWLTHGKYLMQSDRLLSTYGVVDDDTIKVHVRLGGGRVDPSMVMNLVNTMERSLDDELFDESPGLFDDYVEVSDEDFDSQATTIRWEPSPEREPSPSPEPSPCDDVQEPPLQRRRFAFHIIVKSLTNMVATVFVEPYSTIQEIKECIAKMTDIPVESQSLIYKGAQLPNEASMSRHNVQDGDIFFLVLRLRGGGPGIDNPPTGLLLPAGGGGGGRPPPACCFRRAVGGWWTWTCRRWTLTTWSMRTTPQCTTHWQPVRCLSVLRRRHLRRCS